MAKKFSELEAKMSSESLVRSDERYQEMLAELIKICYDRTQQDTFLQGLDMNGEIVRGRVPADLRKEFLAIAADRGLNESAAIHQLIRRFVKREKELRLRDQETMEALADIEAGLTVDGNTVLDWIATWGTDNEKDPPR